MLYGYEVVSLDCSSKYIDAIEIYITLIDQHRDLVKSSALIGAAISSVSDRRRKNTTPPPRGPYDDGTARFGCFELTILLKLKVCIIENGD